MTAGIVASMLAGRAIATQLYSVTANDPRSFAVATAVVAAATIVAAWVPARRAARVDPIVALRAE